MRQLPPSIGCRILEWKAGLSLFTFRALTIKVVSAVGPVHFAAQTAAYLIYRLVVISPRQAGISDNYLPVRIYIANFGGAFGFWHGR